MSSKAPQHQPENPHAFLDTPQPTCQFVAESCIKVLAEQIGKWAEEYPEQRENFQADVEVLWRTLGLLNKCDFLFKEPEQKVEDLAA